MSRANETPWRKPARGAATDSMDLSWYMPPMSGAAFADAWLDASCRHLPEAVPARIGLYEPLRTAFDRERFATMIEAEPGAVLFRGEFPVSDGMVDTGNFDWVRNPIMYVGVSLVAPSTWSDAFRSEV